MLVIFWDSHWIEVFQVWEVVWKSSLFCSESTGSSVPEKVRALEACGTGLLGHKDRLTGLQAPPANTRPPPPHPPTFYLQASFRGACVVARSTAGMRWRGWEVGWLINLERCFPTPMSARPDQSSDESDKWQSWGQSGWGQREAKMQMMEWYP